MKPYLCPKCDGDGTVLECSGTAINAKTCRVCDGAGVLWGPPGEVAPLAPPPCAHGYAYGVGCPECPALVAGDSVPAPFAPTCTAPMLCIHGLPIDGQCEDCRGLMAQGIHWAHTNSGGPKAVFGLVSLQ